MIVAAVDPGANTGLVALEATGSQLATARWIGHAVMRPSQAEKYSPAERDANLNRRLTDWFAMIRPALVVLEEPVSATTHWRGERKQQKGTAFRLGAYYGLALSAAAALDPMPSIVSYPPTPYLSRQGWMKGILRNTLLRNAARLAQIVGAPHEVWELDPDPKKGYRNEDLLMALGVLTFHWAQGAPFETSGRAA